LRASVRDDEKVSFLTLNEKRAAVGYAPIEEPPPEPATGEAKKSLFASRRQRKQIPENTR
jgi:hypothetical protein